MGNTWLDLLAFQGPTGPQGPIGPAGFTAGGDLSGSSVSQLVVSLTGEAGNLDADFHSYTIAKGSTKETRGDSPEVQTTTGTPTRIIATIPIPTDRTCNVVCSITAHGASNSWRVLLPGCWRRTGSGPVVEQVAAVEVPTGGQGLLAGCSASASVSGFVVQVSVTGPNTEDVDWVCNWTSEDKGPAAPSTDPFVSYVSPNHGAQDGSTSVSVFGGNFDGDATVTFDGATAFSITWQNAGRIDCDPPPHAGGNVNVVVTNVAAGKNSGTSGNGAYSYDVTSYNPLADFGAGNCTFWSNDTAPWGVQGGGSLTTGARLNLMTDMSGNANNIPQATVANQPVYQGSVVNSHGGFTTSPTGGTVGASDFFGDAFNGAPQLDTLTGTTGGNFTSCWVGIITSITNDSATRSLGDGLYGDFSAWFGVCAHSRGGGVLVAFRYGASEDGTADVDIHDWVGTGARIAVFCWYDGTNLHLSATSGGVTRSTSAALSARVGSSALQVGTGGSDARACTATHLEHIWWKAHNDSARATTLAGVSARYNV